jgi:large subunit ribosomal protein L16
MATVCLARVSSIFQRTICQKVILARSFVLLRPKKTKYRKFQKRLRNIKPINPDRVEPPSVNFLDHGIYALQGVRMTAAQIEAARLTLVRYLKRQGSAIRVCVFPHIPVTKKPLGTRMGKGKGNVDHFIAFVRPGKMLFEYNCKDDNAREICRSVQHKLPIRVGYIMRTPSNREQSMDCKPIT